MGRGRAKAKQTKVARDLKYNSQEMDIERLAKELHSDAPLQPERDDDEEQQRRDEEHELPGDHRQAQAVRKAGFVVDAATVPGQIGDDEAGAPDRGNDLVIDAVVVFGVVEPHRLEARAPRRTRPRKPCKALRQLHR